ncbi:MAG: hypothetical protein HN350_03940 [Phycisphaerales bacterium]|jgi:uncharacterized protein involved in exopolysaccharide biosynthesis|nr:hypothetical protein [Phycisphaerales bacterium]
MQKGLLAGLILGVLLGGTGLWAILHTPNDEPTQPAAPTTLYTSEAHIAVTPSSRDLDQPAIRKLVAAIETLKKEYAHLATDQTVLTRAINEDLAANGTKLDRIRNTAWFTGDLDGTVKLLQDKLSVTAVQDTMLIRISLTGPNPKELPNVINAVAEALVYMANEQFNASKAKQIKALKIQVEEIMAQLETAQQASESMGAPSKIARMRERHNIAQATLQSLATEISQLKLLQSQAEAALAKLKEQQSTGALASSPEVLQALEQDPTYRSLVVTAKNIEIELESLTERLSEHRPTKATRARLKLIKDKRNAMKAELIKKQITAMMQQQQAQVTAVNDRLQEVENQHNKAALEVHALKANLTTLNTLETKIEALYNQATLLKMEQLTLRIAKDCLPLTLHTSATIPTKPSN